MYQGLEGLEVGVGDVEVAFFGVIALVGVNSGDLRSSVTAPSTTLG